MKICKNCNKEYENWYTSSQGYKYKTKTTFCSKSCSAQHAKGNATKELIEQQIVDFILAANTYCSKITILKGINRSSKTLSKFGISISGIQRTLGFVKIK